MQQKKETGTRKGLWLSLFVLALVAAVAILPTQFDWEVKGEGKGLFHRTESHEPGLENYDIRETKTEANEALMTRFREANGKTAASVADIREGFVRGEESLRTRVPSLKIEYNQDIRIPEVITPDVWKAEIERLTPATDAKRSEVLRNFAKQNAELVGMEPGQLDGLKVIADYANPRGNMAFAQLNQEINGIPVFRGEIKAGFTMDGRIIRVINNLAPGLDYESLSADFRDPLSAVKAAAGHINRDSSRMDLRINESASSDLRTVFGTGDWATTAEKMYFPTEPGVAVPSWRVLIWEPVNAYYVIVDAETGAMLWRKNITEDQTQSATYNVYNNPNAYIKLADSPAPLSPGPVDPTLGTQGALGTRTNVTLIGNEAPYTFNNNGWITDGANITDGNYLQAGIDRDGTNGVDAPQTGNGNRVFTTGTAGDPGAPNPWNPAPGNPAPGDAPLDLQAQRGAVIQMFYAMNRYQSEMYRLGFTEQAFNFQNDNFGRGGAGNDRVSAEGQDSSGTNNANMSTPADGGRGRMQMYVWTGPTPDYDGTADAEVIIHEVTHGLSNRLHGNASGLSTNMARGMGEGWSDFYSYTMLAEPTDPINGIYTTGGYATYLISTGFTGNYYYGIRRFPRAPIAFLGPNGKPHAPLTFRHLNSNCNTEIGTPTVIGTISAFPRGPIGVTQCDQVHNAGEVWSSALWEVRNLFVTRLGFQNGTTRVLQAVTDGMKLAPLGPTFLQERDAIIAAASALPVQPEASADVVDVREGFRRRGMGFSAVVNSASPANVTEGFDFPNIQVVNPFSFSDAGGNNNGYADPGEPLTLNVSVTNATGAAVTGVVVNVTNGGSANVGTINDGQTVVAQLSYTVPADAACGSNHVVTINASSTIGAQAPVQRSFTIGQAVGVVQNFDGVSTPTLPAGWTSTQTGSGTGFVTSTTAPSSAPNAAFASEPTTVGISELESPAIAVTSAAAKLKVKVNHNTENGFDGMVLEIKIGGGAYQDVIAAGGSWAANGYNGTLSTGFSNPLPGRQAWTGNGGGYKNVEYNLPAAANGQNVQFKFRMGTDSSVGGSGVHVDDFEMVSSYVCAPAAPSGRGRADFDGDGKTDVSIFRGTEGNWWINRSTGGLLVLNWGIASDQLAPQDFDGDGKTDTAIFRGTVDETQPDFYILNSNGFTFSGSSWGLPGDVNISADYDGDGKSDRAVYRPSDGNWYINTSSNGGGIAINNPGTSPAPGDYDGDGKADGIMFTGTAWVGSLSAGGSMNTPFGAAGDIPVHGYWDADGKVDHAVFRPSNATWYILRSSDQQVVIQQFGITTDIPAPGDYDGDGKDDIAVYRNGTWWINQSSGSTITVGFGNSTDKVVVAAAKP